MNRPLWIAPYESPLMNRGRINKAGNQWSSLLLTPNWESRTRGSAEAPARRSGINMYLSLKFRQSSIGEFAIADYVYNEITIPCMNCLQKIKYPLTSRNCSHGSRILLAALLDQSVIRASGLKCCQHSSWIVTDPSIDWWLRLCNISHTIPQFLSILPSANCLSSISAMCRLLGVETIRSSISIRNRPQSVSD